MRIAGARHGTSGSSRPGRTAECSVDVSTGADGSCTVVVSGDLDHEGVLAVEAAVHAAAERALGTFTIDTGAVEFVDSAGLRLLLQAQLTTAERGVAFVVAHPSGQLVRLLRLTGLDDLLAIGHP